jgi:hypothetical protein
MTSIVNLTCQGFRWIKAKGAQFAQITYVALRASVSYGLNKKPNRLILNGWVSKFSVCLGIISFALPASQELNLKVPFSINIPSGLPFVNALCFINKIRH